MARLPVIRAIASYLPARTLTNADLEQRFPDWTAARILAKTGIAERRMAAPDQLASDMAVEAARRLMAERSVDPASVDVLVFCSQSLDYILPSTACLIQNRLGLPTTCMSFDLSLGCSSYVYGLSVVGALLEAGRGRRALLLTGDTYSKYLDPEDKTVVTIFGDAGTATLLDLRDHPESATEGTGTAPGGPTREPFLGPFVCGTDGSGAGNLIIEAGGLRGAAPIPAKTIAPGDDEATADAGTAAQARRRPDRLFMDGPKIFEFSLRRVPEAVNRLLTEAGLALGDIDLFVFHQANLFMMEALRKKLKIPPERFAVEIENVGNTVSSTIPLTLEKMAATQRLRSGARVMLVGFGVGYSWAAGIIQWI